ncbi:hypothetical protein HHI36_015431 [Cryptolaemus montrouzieri]|uniref:Uncharacterized protein n=1 Tax=Cryptolaemus montrouzieri TaxID=559131 RepID=A0ABD2N5W6_9CUCU
MASINSLKAEYGFDHLEWNLFAASHGKGAFDGIGRSVKRFVAKEEVKEEEAHSKCTLVLKSPKSTANTDSDWTDDCLEILTNPKLRKRIPDPDISVPSVSDQSKSSLPLKKRLRVSDVYSDSDNEFINDKT